VALCVEYCSEQIKAELKLAARAKKRRLAASPINRRPIRLGFVGESSGGQCHLFNGRRGAVRMLNEKYGKEWGLTGYDVIARAAKNVATVSVSAPVERDGIMRLTFRRRFRQRPSAEAPGQPSRPGGAGRTMKREGIALLRRGEFEDLAGIKSTKA
jgi:hypothetical protein